MYAIPSMITSLGLRDGQEWTSDVHKTVAENLICGRGGIDSCGKLQAIVGWINEQDEDFLKTATIGNLVDAGIPVLS